MPAAEDILRAAVFIVFTGALIGLSLTVGQTVHPVAGWLLPTVVAGVLSVWFGGRWLDERTAARARDVHARPRGESLSIPAGFDPDV